MPNDPRDLRVQRARRAAARLTVRCPHLLASRRCRIAAMALHDPLRRRDSCGDASARVARMATLDGRR